MNIHTLVNWEKTSETLQIVLPGELEKVMSFGFVFVFRHPMMQLAKSRTWPDI